MFIYCFFCVAFSDNIFEILFQRGGSDRVDRIIEGVHRGSDEDRDGLLGSELHGTHG